MLNMYLSYSEGQEITLQNQKVHYHVHNSMIMDSKAHELTYTITQCCFKIHFNITLPSMTLSLSMFNKGNSMHTAKYEQLLQQIRWKIYHLKKVHMSLLTCQNTIYDNDPKWQRHSHIHLLLCITGLLNVYSNTQWGLYKLEMQTYWALCILQ